MENQFALTIPWKTVLSLTFYVLLLIYAIFTIVLLYHWQNYSVSKAATTQTYVAYFTISLPLLGLMALAALAL